MLQFNTWIQQANPLPGNAENDNVGMKIKNINIS